MEPYANQRQAPCPPRRQALRWLAALTCLGPAAVHAAAEAPPLQLAISIDTYQSMHGVWLGLIYREAFRRIGQSIVILPFPIKRSSVLLDSGVIDGELHRVPSYGQGAPQRVLVPEPHFSGAIIAYGLDPVTLAGGWQSLADTPYRVEYRAGSHLTETELRKVVPAKQLSSVSAVSLGLRKLAARRTDLYVDTESAVESLLATDEFRAQGIRPVAVMVRTSAHAFLHSRHAGLVPQLAGALAAMRKEGMIERLRVQAAATPPPRLASPQSGASVTSGN